MAKMAKRDTFDYFTSSNDNVIWFLEVESAYFHRLSRSRTMLFFTYQHFYVCDLWWLTQNAQL